jgi:pSer/pThr/pTyr-binding forkhead associated (FHA) protein
VSFLIQRPAGRGLTLTRIDASELRIGRGTNQDLRSENPAVALEHAVITSDAAGYAITDRGSITGTYVNGKPVETARLSKGDRIEVGDLRIEIQVADPGKPLFLRSSTARAAAAAQEVDETDEPQAIARGARVVKSPKIDFAGSYRLRRSWFTRVSVTAILLIVALGIIGELVRPERQQAFMPGGLSSAHARARDAAGNLVADDCQACHQPWNSVSSAKCLDCHPQKPHATMIAGDSDCFECHAEHRGAARLASPAEQTCSECHRDLAAAGAVQVRSTEHYDFDEIRSISAFGPQHPALEYPNDENILRFNHKLHLAPQGVLTAKGTREVLRCEGCHEMPAAGGEPRPIDFETDCQRCHRLTFDARFPDAEVPHGGEPGIVYGFVAAMYSGDRELAARPAVEVRRILSQRRSVATDQRAVINAEQVIKTRCRVCHDIGQKEGRLAVTVPVLRTEWLDSAAFSHASHRRVHCEQCHDSRQSSATSDVLMPARETCDECHAQRAGQVATPCVGCHDYHFRPRDKVAAPAIVQAGLGGLGTGGRMLQWILLAVIVVLLLVVLIPVGIALFRRLTPEKVPAPLDRSAPPAAAAPSKAKLPPPDQDAPPPSPPPVAAATVADLPLPPAEPAQAGTEMMQWYGMVSCTSGELEGQRWIVEEGGFYIGRDPSLAAVVINDTRISKRHLRIVPRDGKVWAIDQNSTNGTFLRGERITEVQLKRGDALVLGENAATFVYQI